MSFFSLCWCACSACVLIGLGGCCVNFSVFTDPFGLHSLRASRVGGCDAIVDYLDSDGPEFDNSQLNPAILNQVYSDGVRASVNNEPCDERFDYRFILSGELPAGFVADEIGQRYVFTGTPTESMSLYVEVDDGLNIQQSGLCFISQSIDCVLLVNEV